MPDIFDQLASTGKASDIFDTFVVQKPAAPTADIFDQLASQQKPSAPTPQPQPKFTLAQESEMLKPLSSPRSIGDIIHSQSTIAGGKPLSLASTPATEVIGDVLADVPKAVGKGFGAAGDIARGSVADLASNAGYQDYGGNLLAYASGQQMPIDSAIQDARDEAKFRGEFPMAATVAGVSQGLTKTAPKIAALPLAGEGLLAQSIAAGGLFGLQDDGSFSPKEAVIGALMPGVGKVARIGVASALAKAVESGSSKLANPLAQKLVEGMGEQAALNAYQIAANSPEIIQQYKTDPTAAYSTIANIVGSNLAFGLLGAPQLHPDAPSGTELFLADNANKYANAADQMIRQRVLREMPNTPASRDYYNSAAISDLSPQNATFTASQLPEPQEPQNFVGPNMIQALDDLSQTVSQPRIPSPAGVPVDVPNSDLLRPPVEAVQPNPFADVELAPESAPQFLHGTTLEQKNPQGLRVAVRLPSGEIIAGKPGDLHFNLNPPADAELGFVTRGGQFLDREQASKYNTGKTESTPSTLPVRTVEKPPRPVVPETPGEPRESSVETARRLGLNTIEKIRAQWPIAQISREQAREIRNLAFPETARTQTTLDVPAQSRTPEQVPGQITAASTLPRQRRLRSVPAESPRPTTLAGRRSVPQSVRPSFRPAASQRPASNGGLRLSVEPPTVIDRLLQNAQIRQRELAGQTNQELIQGLRLALSNHLGPNREFNEISGASPSLLSSLAGGASKAESLAAAFGKRVVWFDGPANLPSGAILPELDPGVIYINARRPFEQSEISAHELTHLLKVDAPDLFQSLAQAILPRLQNYPELRDYLRSQQYAPRDFPEEIVARVVESVLTKGEVFRRITGEQPSLVARVLSFLADAMRTVERFISKHAPSVGGTQPHLSDIREIQSQIEDAFTEYKRRTVGNEPSQPQISQPRFSIEPFKSKSELAEMQDRVGLSDEQRKNISELGEAQAGAFERGTQPVPVRTSEGAEIFHPNESPAAKIVRGATTPQATIEGRTYSSLVKPVADFLQVSDAQRALGDVQDDTVRQMAARNVIQQDDAIREHLARIHAQAAEYPEQIAAIVKRFPKMNAAEAAARLLEATAEKGSKDYNTYLTNLTKSQGANGVPAAKAAQILNSGAMQIDGHLVPPSVIRNVLEQIAKNDAVKVGPETTPAEIVEQAVKAGGIALPPSQAGYYHVLFEGLNDLNPLLQRISNLPNAIRGLREIYSDRERINREMQEFQNWFSKAGDKVAPSEWARRYHALKREASKADEIATQISDDFDEATQKSAGTLRAARDVEALISSPQYLQALSDAIKIVPTRQLLVDETGGFYNAIRGPVSGEEYRVYLTPTAATEQKNFDSIRGLLGELQTAIADAKTTPLQRESYQRLANYLQASQMDVAFDPSALNFGETLNKNRFGWLTTLQSVLEHDGGRAASRALNISLATDAIRDDLHSLGLNKELGDQRHANLVRAALKAHGLRETPADVSLYQEQIANPIMASQQHVAAQRLMTGSIIPLSGQRVLKEDMEVARADFQHGTEVHKIAEKRRGVVEPILIQEKVNDELRARNAVPTGPMTVARGIAPWAWNFGLRWLGLKPEEQQAVIAQAFTEPVLFNRLIKARVVETNPDFVVHSPYSQDYLRIAEGLRDGAYTINNFDDLVNTIARQRMVPPDVIRPELQRSLANDMSAYLKRFSENVIGLAQPKIQDALRRYSAITMAVDGSFTSERGPQLAPSSFYKFARVDTNDRLALRANLNVMASVKKVQELRTVLSALSAFKRDMEAELELLNGNPTGRAEKMKQIDARHRAGQTRYNYAEALSRIDLISSQIRKIEKAAERSADDLTHVGRELISEGLSRNLGTWLMTSPKATVANFTSGSVGMQTIMSAYLRGGVGALRTVVSFPVDVVKMVTSGVTRMAQKIPAIDNLMKTPGLANAMTKWLVSIAEEQAALDARLKRAGISYSFDAVNKLKSQKERISEFFNQLVHGQIRTPRDLINSPLGTGGKVYSEDSIPDSIAWHLLVRPLRAINDATTQWLAESWAPRVFHDQLPNRLNLQYTFKTLQHLASHAQRIAESRGGVDKLDANNQNQAINAKEVGLRPEGLRWLRTLFQPSGSLESVMFDFARRLMATRPELRSEVPLIDESTPDGKAKMDALIRSAASRLNVVRSGNRPSTFMSSPEWSIVGFFKSYASAAADQMLKLIPKKGSAFLKPRNVAAFGAAIALLTTIGMASYETGMGLNSLATTRQSGLPTLANLGEHPSDEDQLRYLALATATTLPYASFFVDRALGGGDAFDLAGYIPQIDFLRTATKEADTALKTGDWEGAWFNLANRFGGIGAGIVNRLPDMRERAEIQNARRVVNAARPYNSLSTLPQPTRYIKDAQIAAQRGNLGTAKADIQQAIALKQSQGVPLKTATAQVRQSVLAKNPLAGAGRKYWTGDLESRMTASQRASLQTGREGFERLMTLLPKPSHAAKPPIFKGFHPKKQRKFRAFA